MTVMRKPALSDHPIVRSDTPLLDAGSGRKITAAGSAYASSAQAGSMSVSPADPFLADLVRM